MTGIFPHLPALPPPHPPLHSPPLSSQEEGEGVVLLSYRMRLRPTHWSLLTLKVCLTKWKETPRTSQQIVRLLHLSAASQWTPPRVSVYPTRVVVYHLTCPMTVYPTRPADSVHQLMSVCPATL
uniref:Uncharacterized protein n=1 Tax=Cacopsylla melanoneura TaxID=428564 RepID=A0A8D9B658_9HEMI